MKATAYWCLITMHWTENGRDGHASLEGEYFVRRAGTTMRDVFREFQQCALERAGLSDAATYTVVCWDIRPLALPRRRWFQRGDRVPPNSTLIPPVPQPSVGGTEARSGQA